jgi:hypothetical protein
LDNLKKQNDLLVELNNEVEKVTLSQEDALGILGNRLHFIDNVNEKKRKAIGYRFLKSSSVNSSYSMPQQHIIIPEIPTYMENYFFQSPKAVQKRLDLNLLDEIDLGSII